MKFEKMIEIVKELAKSQGYYGRIYQNLLNIKETEDTEAIKEINAWLEENQVKDSLDLVLALEG